MATADIVLLIEPIGDELEMTLVSDTPPDNQRNRRKDKNGEIKDKKRSKKKKAGGAGHGHDHQDTGPHQTMILIDSRGDRVVFTCAQPFVVDVAFDETYLDPDEVEPRRSPFQNWTTPQTSVLNAVSGKHEVVGVFLDAKRKDAGGTDIPNTKPSDYHFYKCTVWSGDLTLDPDWYCDR